MWNTPHVRTGWNLNVEEESTEYFTLNGVTCYHDLLTDKYYAFLGIAGDRKVEFETREALRKGVENKMADIEKQKEDARNLNELTDHLIKLIESDDKRFSFEFCASGTMEIYDKEKEIGYAVHIAPIEYDEDGNATNI